VLFYRNVAPLNPYQLQSPAEVPVTLTHFQRRPTVNDGCLSMKRLNSTSTVTTVPPSSQAANQSRAHMTSQEDTIYANNEPLGIYSNELMVTYDPEYVNKAEWSATSYCNAENSNADCDENCYSEVRS